MRRLGLVTVLPSSRVLSSAEARADGPWCARYGTGLEGSNCGFYSFEQCQAADLRQRWALLAKLVVRPPTGRHAGASNDTRPVHQAAMNERSLSGL